jgi:Flp pilus assembly protein TadD
MTETATEEVAIETDAQRADAQFNEGNALMQAGRFAEAAAAYRRSLALNRTAPRTHNNLAVALAEQRKFGSALAHYREAVRLDPDYAHAHFNFGNAYRELGRHAEAIVEYERALTLAPGWPAALLNRGLALAAGGEQAAAEASYREALAAQPDYPEAHNNLGLALELQGRLDQAMQHFDRALELAPAFANAHANRAQLQLLRGNLREGWPEYEWRWRLPGVGLPGIDTPIWDGTPPGGRSVLLRAEQGLGDTIQFVRFASMLANAGATVVLECQPALVSLLTRVRGVRRVVPRGSAIPRCNTQIPVASLPRVLGITDIAAIPAATAYLDVDPVREAQWRERLAADPALKVGIVWQGSSAHPQDPHRSIPPEHFVALAAVPGVEIVNLQLGQRAPAALRAKEPLAEIDAEQPFSFEDTAAIVANLDLIVTCDTALAHLAGALGVPVWIALPLIPDWRWLLERDDSPWYPSARLFRQTHLDDWSDVFARIVEALATKAKEMSEVNEVKKVKEVKAPKEVKKAKKVKK